LKEKEALEAKHKKEIEILQKKSELAEKEK
jgi:hypothetical protein